MPLVLRIDRYCVFFWSNEREPLEPIHVHVAEGNPTSSATKIWITHAGRCCLCSNSSRIAERTLHNIMRVMEAYQGLPFYLAPSEQSKNPGKLKNAPCHHS